MASGAGEDMGARSATARGNGWVLEPGINRSAGIETGMPDLSHPRCMLSIAKHLHRPQTSRRSERMTRREHSQASQGASCRYPVPARAWPNTLRAKDRWWRGRARCGAPVRPGDFRVLDSFRGASLRVMVLLSTPGASVPARQAGFVLGRGCA